MLAHRHVGRVLDVWQAHKRLGVQIRVGLVVRLQLVLASGLRRAMRVVNYDVVLRLVYLALFNAFSHNLLGLGLGVIGGLPDVVLVVFLVLLGSVWFVGGLRGDALLVHDCTVVLAELLVVPM